MDHENYEMWNPEERRFMGKLQEIQQWAELQSLQGS